MGLGVLHDRGHPARNRQPDSRRRPRRAVDTGTGRLPDVPGGLRARRPATLGRSGVGAGALSALLLTHLHSDHIADLATSSSRGGSAPSLRIPHRCRSSDHPAPPRWCRPRWPRSGGMTSGTGSPTMPISPAHPVCRCTSTPTAWPGSRTGGANAGGADRPPTGDPPDHRFRIEHDGASVVLAGGDTVPCAGLDALAHGGRGRWCTP